MKQRPTFRTILLLAAASLTLVAGVPWRQGAAATDNLDDSLLLLAASRARQAALQATLKSPNELHTLAAAYRQAGAALHSSSPALNQSLYETANQYDARAGILERRRARGGPLHQFGQLLGRVVGRTMDFVGHAAEIYVEGEIDKAIDNVANAPARAVQRQLNPLWRILGSKLGGGLTGFLREPIDRAIQRNVDRILNGRRHRTRPRATAPAPATAPDTQTPSSANVDTLGEFLESDCAVEGLDFTSTTVDYFNAGPNQGPSLFCTAGQVGGFTITPWSDPAQLEAAFQEGCAVSQGFVDEANEWNSQPVLDPAQLMHVILLSDDSDRYMIVRTQYSNVFNCLDGFGLGDEIVDGRFAVHLSYWPDANCGPSDPDAYVSMLEKLEAAAMAAIDRLEAETGP
jgi:hypothetical protein